MLLLLGRPATPNDYQSTSKVDYRRGYLAVVLWAKVGGCKVIPTMSQRYPWAASDGATKSISIVASASKDVSHAYKKHGQSIEEERYNISFVFRGLVFSLSAYSATESVADNTLPRWQLCMTIPRSTTSSTLRLSFTCPLSPLQMILFLPPSPCSGTWVASHLPMQILLQSL